MLQRFLDSLPPQWLSHPFCGGRLDAVILGVCHAARCSEEHPWAMIQYERPYVSEECMFRKGWINPKAVKTEMPYFYDHACSRLTKEDDALAGRFKNLTNIVVAMWRLYFECMIITRFGWDDQYLSDRAKDWPNQIDGVHGSGFGKELWQQIYQKINASVTKAGKEKMKSLMDRSSHSIARYQRKCSGVKEDPYDTRIITMLPTGKEMSFHCHFLSEPGPYFDARDCKTPKGSLPYEGKDPNVTSAKYCKMCHRPEGEETKLLRCKRCRLVHYCCRNCQSEDFKDHKDSCKKVKHLMDELELERGRIMLCPLKYECESHPFESEVGRFGDFPKLRSYLHTQATLGNDLLCIAMSEDNVQMWEAALFQKLECLRLDRLHRSGICVGVTVPHILLYLNRDEDFVAFIRYYLCGDYLDNNEVDTTSKVGDFIYSRGGCSCFDDFVSEVESSAPGNRAAALLLALCTIKMRLVAHFKSRKESFRLFIDTSTGKKLQQIKSVVYGLLVGDDDVFTEQERQVDTLLELIHATNRHMLPAINDPMTVQGASQHFGGGVGALLVGSMNEAYIAVQDWEKPFLWTPGAKEKLEAFLTDNDVL